MVASVRIMIKGHLEILLQVMEPFFVHFSELDRLYPM